LKFANLSDVDAAPFAVLEGDVLLVRTNGTPAYVGRSAVVPAHEGVWLAASYLIRLRVRQRMILPIFLHEALSHGRTRKTMEGAIRTSAGNYNLNTRGIRNALVPVPSLDEQQAICDVAASVQRRIDAEENRLGQLSTCKTTLGHALLSGEIRVPANGAL
jgi:type I restriction enzyme S subunit